MSVLHRQGRSNSCCETRTDRNVCPIPPGPQQFLLLKPGQTGMSVLHRQGRSNSCCETQDRQECLSYTARAAAILAAKPRTDRNVCPTPPGPQQFLLRNPGQTGMSVLHRQGRSNSCCETQDRQECLSYTARAAAILAAKPRTDRNVCPTPPGP